MAILKQTNTNKPLTIDKFLGINLTKAGDTQLELGESGNMKNCYITKDYDLAKIEGYLQLFTLKYNKPIQGMWYGTLDNKLTFIFALNGSIYRLNDNYWLDDTLWGSFDDCVTNLGNLTDSLTNFFLFNNILYIINGYEYKKYIGTGTIQTVTGYIPKTYIGCKPSTGSGTAFEDINLLTGSKRVTFNGDTTSTYKLLEQNIDSIDFVKVDGVTKTITTHYTVNLTTGIITFTSGNIPAVGINNVEIEWTKGTGTRELVEKNRFAELFGEASDNRVFLYGHTDNINQRINSILADGIPSAEYFSATNIDLIGSSDFAITDIKQQQKSMLVFKENETYYSYYDIVNLDGVDIVNFPIYKINDTRGNLPYGQSQLLNNKIYTIDTTLINWTTTQIVDERNMKEIGIRIQRDLNNNDLSLAKTVDYQSKFEMWISIGKQVWIYNYLLDTFSRLTLEDEPTCWILIGSELYFGTTDGRIMKISENYITFNGVAIESHWEMNMFNFGTDYLTKSLTKAWITLASQTKSSCDIKFVTDSSITPTTESIDRSIITFGNVDFSNFTFTTNYNPKTFRLKLRAKKFTYLKLVLDSNEIDTSFVVLNFTLKTETGSETK